MTGENNHKFTYLERRLQKAEEEAQKASQRLNAAILESNRKRYEILEALTIGDEVSFEIRDKRYRGEVVKIWEHGLHARVSHEVKYVDVLDLRL